MDFWRGLKLSWSAIYTRGNLQHYCKVDFTIYIPAKLPYEVGIVFFGDGFCHCFWVDGFEIGVSFVGFGRFVFELKGKELAFSLFYPVDFFLVPGAPKVIIAV